MTQRTLSWRAARATSQNIEQIGRKDGLKQEIVVKVAGRKKRNISPKDFATVAIWRATVSERVFTSQVIQAAKLLGWKAVHFRPARTKRGWVTAGEGDIQGWPDLVLCHGAKGRVIFAELKSDKGKLSDEQADWINDLSCCEQVETYLWRPKEMEEIWNILRGEGYGKQRQRYLLEAAAHSDEQARAGTGGTKADQPDFAR